MNDLLRDESLSLVEDGGIHLGEQPTQELVRQIFDLVEDVDNELDAISTDPHHVPDFTHLLIGIGALAELAIRRWDLRPHTDGS